MRPTSYFAKNLANKDKAAQATELKVESLGNHHYRVTIDGEEHQVEALLLPNGTLSMLDGQQSWSVEFEEKGDELNVMLGGQSTRYDLVDERKLRQRIQGSSFGAEGVQEICAPMPGKIVKVFVKEGDEVKENQPLVVVEAMKMENELKAPRAGKVTKVLAKEGTAVENGAKLVVVE